MALSVTLKNVKLEEKRGSYEWRTFEPRRTNMWDQNLADLGFETGKNRLIKNISLIVKLYTLSVTKSYKDISYASYAFIKLEFRTSMVFTPFWKLDQNKPFCS